MGIAFIAPKLNLTRVSARSSPQYQVLVVRMGRLTVARVYLRLQAHKTARKELFESLQSEVKGPCLILGD